VVTNFDPGNIDPGGPGHLGERPPATLPFGGVPPHNATRTSRAASASMVPHAPRIRDRVLEHIVRAPHGLTCEQVEALMPAHTHQSISARIRELSLMSAVVAVGTRPNPRSGRSARIYFADHNYDDTGRLS
jgi:hypothetical protein